jgi:hypothetical protein
MGIELDDIEDGHGRALSYVSINLAHNDGLDMSLAGNPTRSLLNGFPVYSIFRRRRLSTSDADGNPLIYALKEMKKFRIDATNAGLMWDTASKILAQWELPWQPTSVLALPSRHTTSSDLAAVISDRFGIEQFHSDSICKKSVGEVIADAEQFKEAGGVPDADMSEFKKQLGRLSSAPANRTFQMKEIKSVRVRHYFQPWKSTSVAAVPLGRDVLLVDDLVGSGASLLTCARHLEDQGCSVLGGLSLFSQLDREISPAVRTGRRRRRRGQKS